MQSTRELFVESGLRCTTQRTAIYDALRANTCHPTAEELYQIVRPKTPHLSLSTVYNTLEALCSAGLARKLTTACGCFRFDADMSDHLHVRLKDSSELRDVPHDLSQRLLDELPQDVIRQIEESMGVTIDGVSIQLVASRQKGDAVGNARDHSCADASAVTVAAV